MAVGDVAEDYVSSLGLSSKETKQNGDTVSAEDVAWADSCLIKEPLSDGGWGLVKDALLDTLHSKPDSSEIEKHDFPNGADREMISCGNTAESAEQIDIAADSDALVSGKAENLDANHSVTENSDTFLSRFNLENVFLPTYNESRRDIGTSDSEFNSSFPALADDQSQKDIFKVWDLDTPSEDDEFINQLDKALSQSSLEPLSPAFGNSGVSKDLEDLDGLISSIADMSLLENSL